MAERINERFRLERVVEEGPEGSWHRGVDEKNDKPVLVAITTRAADEWTRAAFEKLQEVGRRVSHPAVAKFVEAGTTNEGSGYVVVDLPTGPTLADRLLSTPPTTSPPMRARPHIRPGSRSPPRRPIGDSATASPITMAAPRITCWATEWLKTNR